jgi:signal transduction histidine kinase
MARFELADAVRTVGASLEAVLEERGARLETGALPRVEADPARVTQVLQNLIANGVKFCPPDRTPEVHVSAERVPAAWRVDVRDNGIGIDPRHAARVFRMFSRLHPADEYAGTGIGLAICKKIVERHGGQIEVRSVEGQGSTFAFMLPALPPDAGIALAPANSTPFGSGAAGGRTPVGPRSA